MALSITSCIPTAARLAFLKGELNAADTYKIGLFRTSGGSGRTYDKDTNSSVLTDITAATSDEEQDASYSQKTLATYAASSGTSVAWIDWTADPQWTTFTTSGVSGAFIYDDTDTVGPDRIVALFNFGASYPVTNGTMTLQFPAAAYNTALIRFA